MAFLGVGLLASAGLAGQASVASAAPPPPVVLACGSVITTDATLGADVQDCAGDGLVIAAYGITLNLNGYEVTGRLDAPDPVTGARPCAATTGEGAGIAIRGYSNVKVTGKKQSGPMGTVRCFDAGVLIESVIDTVTPEVWTAESNEVKHVVVKDNVGDCAGGHGGGIAINNSNDNRILSNVVEHNGPFSGVGVLGTSNLNLVQFNQVKDNNVACSDVVNVDSGVLVDTRNAANYILDNTVSGSGLDGIGVHAGTTGTQVAGNVVRDNGYHDKGHRPGAGIFVSGVEEANVYVNTVCNSAGSGIDVGTGAGVGANEISFNDVGAGTSGCSANATAGYSGTFDLVDRDTLVPTTSPTAVPCGTNVWLNNYTPGDTYNNICTTLTA